MGTEEGLNLEYLERILGYLPNPDRVVAVKLLTNPARASYQDYRNDPLFNYVPLDPMPTK